MGISNFEQDYGHSFSEEPLVDALMSDNKSACCVPAFDENTAQCARASASNCKDEIYKESPAKNSFFVYLYEFRQTLKQGGAKKLKQADICQTAGKRWRQMSECQKQPYKLWASNNRKKARCLQKNKTQGPKPWMPRLCFNCWRQEADIISQARPYAFIFRRIGHIVNGFKPVQDPELVIDHFSKIRTKNGEDVK
uniref:HMG box domain-containing protein n=1 Tax=Glossina pallidipes TaxID=7398 RepID=A0A1A9ZI77_GLOPL